MSAGAIKEPSQKEAPPQPRGKSLGEIAREVFFGSLIIVILAVLGGLGYVAYLEFWVIPTLLISRYGNGAILVHVFSVAGLIVAGVVLAGWVERRGIFRTYKELMAAHTNSTIAAIEHLATGRWASDSYTHKEAFKTGAVLGYKVGTTQEEIELTRGDIAGQLAAFQYPQITRGNVVMDSQQLISDMNDFMLGERKAREARED